MRSSPLLFVSSLKEKSLGFLACLILAVLCKYVASTFDLPVMLLGLLTGLILSSLLNKGATSKGIGFSAKTILRLGVILLGARFVFSDLLSLGLETIIVIIGATVILIPLSVFIAKLLKLDRNLGLLMGGATAICGASAAMAIAALLPKNKDNDAHIATTVLSVICIGSLAMILYPLILPLLPLSADQNALLVGGTIHDVAQVVGAGFSLSEDIGEEAMLIKLIRVFMLIPVILAFAIYFSSKTDSDEDQKTTLQFPLFLIGFVLLITINALGFLPETIREALKQISHWAFIIALVAVGLKTPIKDILTLSWKPFMLVLLNTALLISFYMAFILFI